jgi:hypothetical protein
MGQRRELPARPRRVDQRMRDRRCHFARGAELAVVGRAVDDHAGADADHIVRHLAEPQVKKHEVRRRFARVK